MVAFIKMDKCEDDDLIPSFDEPWTMDEDSSSSDDEATPNEEETNSEKDGLTTVFDTVRFILVSNITFGNTLHEMMRDEMEMDGLEPPADWMDPRNTNFLSLLNLISKFNSNLREYLDSESDIDLASSVTQVQMSSCWAKKVREYIKGEAANKPFSIIVELRSEVLRRDMLLLFIRYVHEGSCVQRFLAMYELPYPFDSESIYKMVSDTLNNFEFDRHFLRAFSFKNIPLVEGYHHDVAKKLKELSPKMVYCHYNRSIIAFLLSTLRYTSVGQILHSLEFISELLTTSTGFYERLEKSITELGFTQHKLEIVKQFDVNPFEAVSVFLDIFAPVLEAMEIEMEEKFDIDLIGAHSFLSEFENIVYFMALKKILTEIIPMTESSHQFSTVSSSISEIANRISQELKLNFDAWFDVALDDAKGLCVKNDVDIVTEPSQRWRSTKETDITLIDGKSHMETIIINNLKKSLDFLISELEIVIHDYHSIISKFDCFSKDDKVLYDQLIHFYSDDLNLEIMEAEWDSLTEILATAPQIRTSSFTDIYSYLHANSSSINIPNISKLMENALVAPMCSSADVKQERIDYFFEDTTYTDNITDRALVHIEKEITDIIDCASVVEIFESN